MPAPTRTLVAVIPSGAEGQTHTLYFDDGTVVAYDPALNRVLRVHRLPDELGDAQEAVVTVPRHTPTLTISSTTDRRQTPRE